MPAKPSVASLVLADSHKAGANGKIDAFGLFNTVFVWALPTSRECSFIVGLENVPAGPLELRLWLRRPGKDAKTVGRIDATSSQESHSVMIAHRIPLQIAQLGRLRVGISVGDGRVAWTPLLIEERPWPELPTGEALTRLLADPHAIKAARVELQCGKCHTKYVFEIHADPAAKPPKGVRRFPEDGKFRCPKCGTLHHLRDLEGRLRAQIGESVSGVTA